MQKVFKCYTIKSARSKGLHLGLVLSTGEYPRCRLPGGVKKRPFVETTSIESLDVKKGRQGVSLISESKERIAVGRVVHVSDLHDGIGVMR